MDPVEGEAGEGEGFDGGFFAGFVEDSYSAVFEDGHGGVGGGAGVEEFAGAPCQSVVGAGADG